METLNREEGENNEIFQPLNASSKSREVIPEILSVDEISPELIENLRKAQDTISGTEVVFRGKSIKIFCDDVCGLCFSFGKSPKGILYSISFKVDENGKVVQAGTLQSAPMEEEKFLIFVRENYPHLAMREDFLKDSMQNFKPFLENVEPIDSLRDDVPKGITNIWVEAMLEKAIARERKKALSEYGPAIDRIVSATLAYIEASRGLEDARETGKRELLGVMQSVLDGLEQSMLDIATQEEEIFKNAIARTMVERRIQSIEPKGFDNPIERIEAGLSERRRRARFEALKDSFGKIGKISRESAEKLAEKRGFIMQFIYENLSVDISCGEIIRLTFSFKDFSNHEQLPYIVSIAVDSEGNADLEESFMMQTTPEEKEKYSEFMAMNYPRKKISKKNLKQAEENETQKICTPWLENVAPIAEVMELVPEKIDSDWIEAVLSRVFMSMKAKEEGREY